MTSFVIVVLAILLVACVRQIRRLNRDVAALYSKPRSPNQPDTETRLRALEFAERRRQQATAEGRRP